MLHKHLKKQKFYLQPSCDTPAASRSDVAKYQNVERRCSNLNNKSQQSQFETPAFAVHSLHRLPSP